MSIDGMREEALINFGIKIVVLLVLHYFNSSQTDFTERKCPTSAAAT